jgi:hypothetical protein
MATTVDAAAAEGYYHCMSCKKKYVTLPAMKTCTEIDCLERELFYSCDGECKVNGAHKSALEANRCRQERDKDPWFSTRTKREREDHHVPRRVGKRLCIKSPPRNLPPRLAKVSEGLQTRRTLEHIIQNDAMRKKAITYISHVYDVIRKQQ